MAFIPARKKSSSHCSPFPRQPSSLPSRPQVTAELDSELGRPPPFVAFKSPRPSVARGGHARTPRGKRPAEGPAGPGPPRRRRCGAVQPARAQCAAGSAVGVNNAGCARRAAGCGPNGAPAAGRRAAGAERMRGGSTRRRPLSAARRTPAVTWAAPSRGRQPPAAAFGDLFGQSINKSISDARRVRRRMGGRGGKLGRPPPEPGVAPSGRPSVGSGAGRRPPRPAALRRRLGGAGAGGAPPCVIPVAPPLRRAPPPAGPGPGRMRSLSRPAPPCPRPAPPAPARPTFLPSLQTSLRPRCCCRGCCCCGGGGGGGGGGCHGEETGRRWKARDRPRPRARVPAADLCAPVTSPHRDGRDHDSPPVWEPAAGGPGGGQGFGLLRCVSTTGASRPAIWPPYFNQNPKKKSMRKRRPRPRPGAALELSW